MSFFLASLALVSGRVFLFFPIMTLFYRESIGLSFEEILLNQIVFSVTTTILEVPTGFLSDRWGEKRVLILANILSVFSLFSSYGATAFSHIILASILAGLANSCYSGASSAFVYKLLEIDGRAHEFRNRTGRIKFYSLLSLSLASLPAGLILESNVRMAYLLSVPFQLLSLLALLFVKVRPSHGAGEKSEGFFETFRNLKGSSVFVLIVSYGIIITIFETGNQLYQPFLVMKGLTRSFMGVYFVIFMVCQALGSKFSDALANKMGTDRAILALPFFSGGLFIFLFFPSHVLIIALYSLIGFCKGLADPLFSHAILRSTRKNRATVLSLVSFLKEVSFIGIAFILIPYLHQHDLRTIFPLIGCFFLIPAALFFNLRASRKSSLSS